MSQTSNFLGWVELQTLSRVQTNAENMVFIPNQSSPTYDVVVAETLVRAQKVAEDCGKRTISAIFLAIAKKAMQIQSSEKPKYNYVFINLGAFHIELEFFSSAWERFVWKYIVFKDTQMQI